MKTVKKKYLCNMKRPNPYSKKKRGDQAKKGNFGIRVD